MKKLNTSKDFTDLLHLTDFATQVQTLKFLNDNLNDYKERFLKEHIKTYEEQLERIPEDDIVNWHVISSSEILYPEKERCHYNSREWEKYVKSADNIEVSNIEFSNIVNDFKDDLFLFDPSKKKLLHLHNVSKMSEFTISLTGRHINIELNKNIECMISILYRRQSWNAAKVNFLIVFDSSNATVLSHSKKLEIETFRSSESW